MDRHERYQSRIALLPERWGKVVENGENYFDLDIYSTSLRNKSILETKRRQELSSTLNIFI